MTTSMVEKAANADEIALAMRNLHLEEETREAITSAQQGSSLTYPSEWFEKNGWIKPKLTLPKLLDTDTYAGLKRPIREGITKGRLVSAKDIKLFLHFLLKYVKEEAPMDWISMGVVIAKKGDKIGPLDLFTLKVEETGKDRVNVVEQEDAEKLAYLILITGCYRISNEKDKLEKEKSMKLINTKTAEAGLRGRYIENCLPIMKCAYYDRELIKLFSGMDMFYNLFPNSDYAQSRVGTECLRFKDCPAMGYLDYLVDFMKIPARDFIGWFKFSGLEEDWDRISVPNQEVDVPHSYTPYMMGLGLARKSPYSASSNPLLHTFVHFLGCSALQPRSINEVLLAAQNRTAVLQQIATSIAFYYIVHRAHSNVSPPSNGSEEVGANLLPFEFEKTDREPYSKRFSEWCKYMRSNYMRSNYGTTLPCFMLQALYRVWATIESPRDGTYGAAAKAMGVSRRFGLHPVYERFIFTA